MWPKWSAASGTSMPTISRTCTDVFGHQGDTLGRQFDAGEHMLGVERFRNRLAQWLRDGTGNALQQVVSQIHLEPGKALVAARFQPLAVDLRIVRFGGVGITADLVPELAAEHLIHGYAIGLAGEIPERHLDTADSAGLARMKPELLDLTGRLCPRCTGSDQGAGSST